MGTHARERLQQRYNVELTRKEEKGIINLINKGEFIPLDTDTHAKDRKFAYVKFKNIPIKVLYAFSKKGNVTNIVTVFPLDVEEYNNLIDGDNKWENLYLQI